MKAIFNELKILGEIWKEEIEYIQRIEVEQKMKLYKKALKMIKRGFKVSDIEWIIDYEINSSYSHLPATSF